MTVIAVDPYLPEAVALEQDVALVSLSEVFEKADIISLHLFAAADSPPLCDAAFFSQLKDSPC